MPQHDPSRLTDDVLAFLGERHLATLTTLRRDGSPHVVAVGFTFDATLSLARVITFASSQKVANVRARPDGRAALCQVDGGRWLTLEGSIEVTDEAERVAAAVAAYATRYRQPGDRIDRVALEVRVDRVMGRA